MRVYLAGPEVFLADRDAIAAAKKAICAQHGMIGVFPTDPAPGAPKPQPIGCGFTWAMRRISMAAMR
jgi:nucleoside 2-deoxyribosyltransferase